VRQWAKASYGGGGAIDGGQRASLTDTALDLAGGGLVELDVLAQRASDVLRQAFPNDLSCVTILEADGVLQVRSAYGNRTNCLPGLRVPIGSGLGGVVVAEGRTLCVTEYARLNEDAVFNDIMVEREGIRAAAGVPLIVNGSRLGLLFVGRRGAAPITESELARLEETGRSLGPLIGASMELATRVEIAKTNERQRLAIELHEQILPLLFAIGAAATRVQRSGSPAVVNNEIFEIENMASTASALVRNVISVLGPLPPEQELGIRIRTATESFTRIHRIPASLSILGHAFAVSNLQADVLSAVAHEALNNVAKHAGHASVILTLVYDTNAITLIVQDDGRGLPLDFGIRAITETRSGEHFGLASLAYRLRLLQGRLEAFTNEDGGVTVRALIPQEVEATAGRSTGPDAGVTP